MDVSQLFHVNISLSMLRIYFYPPHITKPQSKAVTRFCLPLADGPPMGLGLPAQGIFTQHAATASHILSCMKFSITTDG